MNKFYITTPIYYPNARPHIGSAYTTIACDAIARYKRMCGYDVAFLTGTDEHGEKLQRAADAAGVPVEQFVAEKRELFKQLWRTLGIPPYSAEHPAGYRFVHTSQNPRHRAAVQWMIRQADKAGYIEKKKYEGRYCVFDERYVSDSTDPVNCDICGRPAELISEDNYFFKLSAFQERLLKHYDEHHEFVLPDFRMNEVKSFVKSGLRDISISRRRLKWGVPWPDDPGQVVYVWYDALTSYLSGIGFEGEKRSDDFNKYWMDPESERVHMIGKDILRFHAVYWPAFLWAAGLPLPKTIFAHGWIYYQQDKMSKSKGNVIYPEPIIKAFEEFGAPGNDALRYYLLRDTPFGLDGNFSYDGLIQRYNSDLANGIGNLTSRVIHMVRTSPGGLGERPARVDDGGETKTLHDDFFGYPGFRGAIEGSYRHPFDRFLTSMAAATLQQLTTKVDAYLANKKPWQISELIPKQNILYAATEALHALGILLYPVAPHSAERLWVELGCKGSIQDQRLDNLKPGMSEPGMKVGKPEPIFPRLKKEEIIRRIEELAEADRESSAIEKGVPITVPAESQPDAAAPAATGQSPITNHKSQIPQITIDDFAKVDLRAGTVVSAEPIPGATKLLKLQVDIGTEVRQICAGIAEYYKPEQLVGMKVVIVANLQPRKLRGIESNGMIVAASLGNEGKPVLATFGEDVPNGARLK